MKKEKLGLFILVIILTSIVIIGCSSNDSAANSESNNDGSVQGNDDSVEDNGGELHIGIAGQPDSLDPLMSRSIITKNTSRLLFETLIAPDSDFEPQPMLAKSFDISDDGKTYTFQLREGIKFHNGDEMMAEDVVASMNRWQEKSKAPGKMLREGEFEKKDKYTVELNLDENSPLAMNEMLATAQYAAIMPKEVVKGAPTEGVEEFIGTGPFKYEEWKQDQYIHFKKNEEYQPVDQPADGLAGEKLPLVDDIYFDIASDASTRLSGLDTGLYDVILNVPYDRYEEVKNDSTKEVYSYLYGDFQMFYNKVKGIMSNDKMRKAVNAAIDNEEVMMGSVSNKDLIHLEPGYMNPENETWSTDAGKEYYNQGDPEKAKKLAEEAGYDGEEIRLMLTKDFEYFYNAGVVVQQQLEQAGFNVELNVYDWPTQLEKQNDTDAFDMSITGVGWVNTPSQLNTLSPDFAGGVNDEKVPSMLDEISTASTPEESKEKWVELQQYSWEHLMPVTNFGAYDKVLASTDKVEGISTFSGPIFWNTKLQSK